MPTDDLIAELERLLALWKNEDDDPSAIAAACDLAEDYGDRILTALRQAATDREQRDEHEAQLVRIAQVFGKDARHGPDGDPTIAGMVAKELDNVRHERDTARAEVERAKAAVDGVDVREGHVRDNADPDQLRAMLLGAGLEIERLKRGDFTEEEFQNFCHREDPAHYVRFIAGCNEYQRKLFGKCEYDEMGKALEMLTARNAELAKEVERLRVLVHVESAAAEAEATFANELNVDVKELVKQRDELAKAPEAERERCAKIADDERDRRNASVNALADDEDRQMQAIGGADSSTIIADRIRVG
jgi:hypothetical protein